MTGDELRTWYLSLPDSSKLIFLALVSQHLTIHGRGLGLGLTGGTFQQALLGLNELQHQISGEIVDLGLGRDKGSTDILWEILQEEAAKFGLGRHLRDSLEYASSRKLWDELSK